MENLHSHQPRLFHTFINRGSELSQKKGVSCFLAMCGLLGAADGETGTGGWGRGAHLSPAFSLVFFFPFSMGSAKAWARAGFP